ncbi:calcineurin-like phosphoesterase C-terminal domain-containing protein [Niabella hirudinis]|uniref:calcineurin-like phosphoesterase C-terminal domain-containing protein n=1 Tax=Niabella hirudinis TaxID=1285929 RepID=UPI003EB8C4BF
MKNKMIRAAGMFSRRQFIHAAALAGAGFAATGCSKTNAAADPQDPAGDGNSALPDMAGMTVKGRVTCAGTGVPGVVVSDGVAVTTTNADGIYYLPSAKTKNFVFISVPGGYEVGAANTILPAFYQAFKAAASVVETMNFTLTKTDNDRHVVLALGDMHLANRNDDVAQFQNGFLPDAKATIERYRQLGYKVYGLTLGDMTWDAYWYANKYGFAEYLSVMKNINIPVFHTMGNHDNDPYVAADWAAEAGFRASLGPTYYSFNLGKVHYIVLDNIEYVNTGGARGTVGDRSYNETLVASQLAWLKKDLAAVADKSAPVILAMHIHLNNNPSASETASLNLTNAADLISCFSGFSNVHVLTGHTHICYAYENTPTLMEHNSGAVCATWWWTGKNGYAGNQVCKDGAPGGYAIWKFDNTDYDWRYKAIGYDEQYQFRAYDLNQVHITAADYAPKTTDALLAGYADGYATKNAGNEILVNVWGYDKRWKVELFENGTTPLAVTRVKVKDPLHIISYEALRLNAGATPTSDFCTTTSAHLFKATALSPVSPVLIKVTDRFGNVYSETMTRPKALTLSMK